MRIVVTTVSTECTLFPGRVGVDYRQAEALSDLRICLRRLDEDHEGGLGIGSCYFLSNKPALSSSAS